MFYDKYGYFAQRPIPPDRWGAIAPDMPPGQSTDSRPTPPGILAIENFFEPAQGALLLHECEAAQSMPHAVGAEGKRIAVENDVRKSEHIDVRALKTDIVSIVQDIFVKTVAPHFNAQIEWFERPEILRYRSGGKYVPHADSENWGAVERRWKRVINRDLSVLIYLNDDFEGGEISFSNFGYKVKPRAGLLIAFPSDHRYLHEAHLVKSGVRYAIVSWAATVGGPRIDAALKPNIIPV